MQHLVSRRKLLMSGLLIVAGSSCAFAREGEGDFAVQLRRARERRRKNPGYRKSQDRGSDFDWERFDDPGYGEDEYDPGYGEDEYDPGYGEDEYDPALLPPPEADFDYPIEPVDLSLIEPRFRRQVVEFDGLVKPGTIIVDPAARFLYHVRGQRQAVRYGVGVGREGFAWSGKAEIRMKRRWPRWVPPKDMVARDARARKWANGQPGGPGNPLGARALYLYANGKDTLYRIHGTTEPESIGKSVSSGCIRMLNEDVAELFEQVPIGTQVIVRPA